MNKKTYIIIEGLEFGYEGTDEPIFPNDFSYSYFTTEIQCINNLLHKIINNRKYFELKLDDIISELYPYKVYISFSKEDILNRITYKNGNQDYSYNNEDLAKKIFDLAQVLKEQEENELLKDDIQELLNKPLKSV